jgi:hypothetical protein
MGRSNVESLAASGPRQPHRPKTTPDRPQDDRPKACQRGDFQSLAPDDHVPRVSRPMQPRRHGPAPNRPQDDRPKACERGDFQSLAGAKGPVGSRGGGG